MRKKTLVFLILMVLSVGFLFAQGKDDAKNESKNDSKQTEMTSSKTADSDSAEVEQESAYDKWVYRVTKDMKDDAPAKIFLDSGQIAWVILGIFLYSVIYFVLRFKQLFFKEKINSFEFHQKIKNLVQANNLDAAKKATELVKQTTLGQVYRIGLLAFDDAKKSGKKGDRLTEEVQNAFAEANYETIPEIDRGLSWFDFLAQSSTYLGLLGTILGLIKAFSNTGGDSTALMGGIRQAMGTTAIGLISAIIISGLKMFLSSKAEKIISNVDSYSVKIMNVINNTQVQE